MLIGFHDYLLLLCLLSNVALSVLENVGFIFRSAGFVSGNPVAGYTMQSSLGFLSRIFSFALVPTIAWLADSGLVHLTLPMLFVYFGVLLAFLYICSSMESKIIDRLSGVICSVQRNGSLLRLFKLKYIPRILHFAFALIRSAPLLVTGNKPLVKLTRKDFWIVALFSISYIPYYSAWIVVCILLQALPDKPAFCISLVTFMTFACTLVQALIFDPYLASLAEDKFLSLALYSELINGKFKAAFCSSVASFLLFLHFVH